MDKYKLLDFAYGKLYHQIDDHDSIINVVNNNKKYQDWIIQTAKDVIAKNKLTSTKKQIIIDVGANIGTMTIPFAQFADEVYSFDPVKITFDTLQLNVKENNLTNVTLFNCALNDTDGNRKIFVNNSKLGASSFYDNVSNGYTETIETKTLDSFNFENIAFIKIDVQGAEIDVLKGATQTIIKNQCHLIVELPNRNEKEHNQMKDVLKFFSKINYQMINREKKDVHFAPIK